MFSTRSLDFAATAACYMHEGGKFKDIEVTHSDRFSNFKLPVNISFFQQYENGELKVEPRLFNQYRCHMREAIHFKKDKIERDTVFSYPEKPAKINKIKEFLIG